MLLLFSSIREVFRRLLAEFGGKKLVKIRMKYASGFYLYTPKKLSINHMIDNSLATYRTFNETRTRRFFWLLLRKKYPFSSLFIQNSIR